MSPTLTIDGESISTATIFCRADNCHDSFKVTVTTSHPSYVGDQLHQHDLMRVCERTGAMLGWRRDVTDGDAFWKDYCPTHARELRLECARCLQRDCSCMDGPRLLARRDQVNRRANVLATCPNKHKFAARREERGQTSSITPSRCPNCGEIWQQWQVVDLKKGTLP